MADPPKAKADFLHRKIGPLTGLQWGLLVGGAVGLIVLYRKRKSAASASGAGLTSLGNGLFGDAYGNIYDQAGNLLSATQPTIAGGTSGLGSTTGTGVASPQTNTDWLRTAITDLIGAGADPVASTRALTNYISGQSLSAADQSILGRALGLAGPPPSPLPIGVTTAAAQGPSFGTMRGSGFGIGATAPITVGQGTFQQIFSPAFEPAVTSGTGTYAQLTPGVFTPTSGTGVGGGPVVIDPATGKPALLGSNPLGLAPGTPEFIKVPA